MGYTLLYLAFGVVALWLLGEVFLQHKARLRWRALAFVGFLFVVIGVILPQVVVIILGAIGFGTGQTFVTLSHRRGFVTGWALGGKPGSSRRRRDTNAADRSDPRDDPEFEDAELEGAREAEAADEGETADAMPPEGDDAPVYSPSPLPEETPAYGVYSDDSYASAGYDEYAADSGYGSDWQAQPQPAAAYSYDAYDSGADDVFAKGADGLRAPAADPSYAAYDQSAYQQQQGYQSYESYDPYAGASAGYESYDYGQGTDQGQYQPQQDYAAYQQQPQYSQDGYQQQGYGYPSQPPADGWSQADPYGGQQPHIPQQSTPGYQQEQPAEDYQDHHDYQQYEPYQPYRY